MDMQKPNVISETIGFLLNLIILQKAGCLISFYSIHMEQIFMCCKYQNNIFFSAMSTQFTVGKIFRWLEESRTLAIVYLNGFITSKTFT